MKKFLNNHYLVAGIVIGFIVIATGVISWQLSKKPTYDFISVKKADITQAIAETGTVTSAQDLALSFQRGGNVADIAVKTGDAVKKGQVLLSLDAKDAAAAVNQAKAAVEIAQANYQKILAGATGPEIDIAQTNYDNAVKTLASTKAQQDVLVKIAYRNLLNSTITAQSQNMGSGTTIIPTITGSYNSDIQGQYTIRIYAGGDGRRFAVTGMEVSDGIVDTTPQPLGTRGLQIQFPTTAVPVESTWVITIPNTAAPNYVGNESAYEASLQTQNQALTAAQAAVDAAHSALLLKQTPARPEDVAVAKAQVDAAQAQLQNAQSIYSNGVITAPIDGIVATLDAKVGELATPGKPIISLISQQKFEVETYVSEADLAKVKVGDLATVTLDAYGPGTPFAVTVISIDPGATMSGTIQTYKTVLQFNQEDDRIKTGMAANVRIIDETHHDAVVVPTQAVITKNTDKFVLVDVGNGQVRQQAVQTGISSLDGYTEITSGLSEQDHIATFGQ